MTEAIRSVARGYELQWSWLHWQWGWFPSTPLLREWIDKGEDGYFTARCLSLKSCISQGKTREEALENIKEAIDLYLGL